MPRPGEAPAPLYQGLPYGANSLANDMSEAIPDDDGLFDDGFDELADMAPASEDEDFLFSGTDRPNEPLTAGMQFGPGPDHTRFSFESEPEFRQRIANQLAADPSPEVQAFRVALERGL